MNDCGQGGQGGLRGRICPRCPSRPLRPLQCIILTAAIVVISSPTIRSQQPRIESGESKPRLYVIATSHLDSQWNWTVQDTIREFVPNTFFQNFRRFEKYPDYTFNYEG